MLDNPETTPSHTETATVNSAMQGLYDAFDVSTPLELSNKFTELDQEEMKAGQYDYDDPDSEVNKAKIRLETLDASILTEEEKRWRDEMLWLWHHHAAGYALFGHRDSATAQHFAEMAMSYQASDHPNKLTKLLLLLAQNDITGAKEHISTIPEDSVEYESALVTLDMYEQQSLNRG